MTTGPDTPETSGQFSLDLSEDLGDMLGGGFKAPEFYADAAVIAYKESENDVPIETLHAKITTSGGSIDAALLNDGDLVKTVAHVAFEVDDLATAIAGHKILITPNSPSPGVLVAFIEVNGAPVELMQVDRALRPDV